MDFQAVDKVKFVNSLFIFNKLLYNKNARKMFYINQKRHCQSRFFNRNMR